jgi:hypothetical protein
MKEYSQEDGLDAVFIFNAAKKTFGYLIQLAINLLKKY